MLKYLHFQIIDKIIKAGLVLLIRRAKVGCQHQQKKRFSDIQRVQRLHSGSKEIKHCARVKVMGLIWHCIINPALLKFLYFGPFSAGQIVKLWWFVIRRNLFLLMFILSLILLRKHFELEEEWGSRFSTPANRCGRRTQGAIKLDFSLVKQIQNITL